MVTGKISRPFLPRIALTGASGYTGAAFLRALSKMPAPWPVTALVQRVPEHRLPFVDYVSGSLPDGLPDHFPPHDTDVIVHLANENRSRDRNLLSAVNVEGTRALLAAAPDSTKGVVFGSSMSVYGQGPQIRVDEAAPTRPGTRLGRSRLSAEHTVSECMRERNGSAYLLRPRFLMGRDDDSFLPGIRKLRALPLRVSTRRTLLSVIDIDDYGTVVAQVARRVMERAADCVPTRTAVNVAYREPLSLRELFDLVQPPQQRPPIRWLPAGPVTALCAGIPGTKALRLKEQLELVTRSHWADVSALEGEIGSEITAKSPVTVLRSYESALGEEAL